MFNDQHDFNLTSPCLLHNFRAAQIQPHRSHSRPHRAQRCQGCGHSGTALSRARGGGTLDFYRHVLTTDPENEELCLVAGLGPCPLATANCRPGAFLQATNMGTLVVTQTWTKAARSGSGIEHISSQRAAEQENSTTHL